MHYNEGSMWIQVVAALIMIPVFAVSLMVIIVAVASVAETIFRVLKAVWKKDAGR